MKRVGPGLRREIDRAAHDQAIFTFSIVCINTEFLNRIEAGQNTVTGGLAFGVDNAIYQIQIASTPLPINAWLDPGGARESDRAAPFLRGVHW